VDNLTHALAGMLIAEAAVQLRAAVDRRASAGWRSAAYVVSVAANNLPDLDFLWSRITPRPFGYLLHHRGHSHTIPAAFVFAALLWGAVMSWGAWQKARFTRTDRRWIAALSLLGPFVHIAMDSCNNYGTHPFWPLYSGWIYGDAVFILEPAFWASSIPPLVLAARSAVTRATLLAVLGLGLGAAFYVPFVPAPMAFALAGLALASFAMARSTGAGWRALVGIGASLAVAGMFFVAASVARAAVRAALDGADEVHDVVVTPMPANPLCFTAVTVERSAHDYIARRAVVATWPALFPIGNCPDVKETPTAPLRPTSLAGTAHVLWRGEYVAPVARLRELDRDNCEAAALLRFFRVPYWVDDSEETLVFGDLRYDRNPGLDFSDARIHQSPSSCPPHVPSWAPPRHDLLEGDQ
jgi:inner membrane protein